MFESLKTVRRALLLLDPGEGRITYRGFHAQPPATERLERIMQCFIAHYNFAVEQGMSEPLIDHIHMVDTELQGFAYEAAAMGLHVLDAAVPFCRGHVERLMSHAPQHRPLLYVGIGFARGALHLSCERELERHTNVARVWIVDGYAFCRVIFHTEHTLHAQHVPARIARNIDLSEPFDAGVGRGMWFALGGDPERIASCIRAFPERRRTALWRGVGFGATYAGGSDLAALLRLAELAHIDHGALALGCALACHARHMAGNVAPHNRVAAEALCACSSDVLHDVVATAIDTLGDQATQSDGVQTWPRLLRQISSRLLAVRMASVRALDGNTSPLPWASRAAGG